jgi:hypothetical protein
LTVSSTSTRPDLFHSGNAHGVRPSELFPPEEPERLSTPAALLTFTSSGSTRRTLAASSLADPWLPRTATQHEWTETGHDRLQGLAPPGSPLPTDGGLDRRRPDALLGFCSSRDIPPRRATRLTRGNSRGLGDRFRPDDPKAAGWSRALPFRACNRGGIAALSRERPPLLKFPTLSRHSEVRELPGPGSWFHLGSRDTLPHSDRPSLDRGRAT